MKTTNSISAFPNGKMIALYITAVILFSFLCVIIPTAGESSSIHSNSVTDFVEQITQVDYEPEMEVQSWMLSFTECDI